MARRKEPETPKQRCLQRKTPGVAANIGIWIPELPCARGDIGICILESAHLSTPQHPWFPIVFAGKTTMSRLVTVRVLRRIPSRRFLLMPTRALLLAASLFATGAHAVLIVNPGFESNVLTNPGPGQIDNFVVAVGQGATLTNVPGWTFAAEQLDTFTSYGGVSDLAAANHGPEGALDNNIAWFFINEARRTASVSATQTLGDGLQPGMRYTLSGRVAQSARAEGNPALDNPLFPTLGDGVSTGDVFLRLYVGAPGTALPGFVPGLSSVSAPADNVWVSWTLTWETGATEPLAGMPLGVELFNRANTLALSVPVEVFFDDIALVATPVPEPGAAAFVVAGLLFGGGRLRRRTPARVATTGLFPPAAQGEVEDRADHHGGDKELLDRRVHS
jgi:hypothetical protein